MKATDRLKRTQTRLAERLKRYRAARSARKQRGVTLLEIIIVLGIIGTIAAGVVILAQRAFDNKAVADLVANVNTIRVAAKDAYGQTGTYPAYNQDAATLTDANFATNAGNSMIGRLILLGKLTQSEAKNPISGNYINVGGAGLGTAATTGVNANKGFVVQLNGLNQQQCRNILGQVGNQWDFVEVANPFGAGAYPTGSRDLTEAPSGFTAATGGGTPTMSPTGRYRTLAPARAGGTGGGNNLITADAVVTACVNDSSNTIILGSR